MKIKKLNLLKLKDKSPYSQSKMMMKLLLRIKLILVLLKMEKFNQQELRMSRNLMVYKLFSISLTCQLHQMI